MTTDSAIPSADVLDVTDAEDAAELQAAEQQQKPSSLTPREQKMQRLVATHEADLTSGTEAVTHPHMQELHALENPAPAAVDEPNLAVDDEPATLQGAEPAPVADNDLALLEQATGLKYERGQDGQLFTTLKINGTVQRVPADRVAQHLQKDLAGDLKLNQASTLTQQAQRLLHEAQARTTQPPASGVDYDAEARQFLDALYDDSDPDAAAKQLSSLLRKTAAPATRVVSDEALMPLVNKALDQRDYLTDLDGGKAAFAKDYAHLATDEHLMNMVDRESLKVEAENPDWKPSEIIKKAADNVDQWFKSKGGQVQQSRVDTSDRAKNKQQLIPIPAAASQRFVQPKAPAVDNSPVGVIRGMRSTRGAFRGNSY